jgi:uncharacterized protein
VLTLEGVCRFRIRSEAAGRRGYRRMAVDYAPFRHDLDDDDWTLDREPFFALLKQYLDVRGLRVDAEALERAPDRLVIATLGMMCPFDLKEKQALVEAKDMRAMTEIMRSLMQMSVIAGVTDDQSTAKH